MSWGTKIALTYIIFVVITLGIVLFAMTKDVDLVTENYYEKELVYQNQIDKMNRANSLSEKVTVMKDESSLSFVFPKDFDYYAVEGEIHFYRPDNSKRDVIFPIQLDSSYMQIVYTDKFDKGMWKLNVDWAVKNTTYFNEFRVMID
jgi:hypothetical protein